MYTGSCQMAHVGILATLSWGRGARLVVDAIASAHRGRGTVVGTVVVAGAPALALVLRDRGLEVVVFGGGFSVESLPFADAELAALVVRGAEPKGGWLRAVRPGGAVVLVGAPPAAEQSRRALCAGLVDLEQRRTGRLVVTSGRTPAR